MVKTALLESKETECEIWKECLGHPKYQISSRGRIKSFKQNRENGKILSPSVDSRGILNIHSMEKHTGCTGWWQLHLFQWLMGRILSII